MDYTSLCFELFDVILFVFLSIIGYSSWVYFDWLQNNFKQDSCKFDLVKLWADWVKFGLYSVSFQKNHSETFSQSEWHAIWYKYTNETSFHRNHSEAIYKIDWNVN